MYGFVPFKKMRQYRSTLALIRDFSHPYVLPTDEQIVERVRVVEGSVTCGQCRLRYHPDCATCTVGAA